MRLLSKMPLAIAAIVLVYFVLMLGVQQLFIQPRFDTLERASALRDLDRVTAAVNREALHLAVLGRTWSLWDDTYAFMEGRSRSYVSTDLSPDSVRSLGVDLIALYGTDGSLRFEGIYDWSSGTTLPAELLPASAPARAPFLLAAAPDGDITGFMESPRGVLVLASTPILRTDGSGPSLGRFIVGHFIDRAFTESVAEQTSVRLQLKSARESGTRELDSILAHGDRMVEADPSGAVTPAVGVMRDLWGAPAILVRVETERNTSAWARETMRIANILVYSFGLGLFLILFFLLRRLVVQPIAAIQGHLVAWESDQTAAIPRAIVSRRDEIGALATAFVHMGDALAARRRDLERLNESLEAAVEARTGELRISNEDLRLMARSSTARRSRS